MGKKVWASQVSGYLSDAGHQSARSAPSWQSRRSHRSDGQVEYRTAMSVRDGGHYTTQDGADALVRFVGSSAREAEQLAEYRRILENCNLAVAEEHDPDPGREANRLLRVSRR